jgi:hypothetical protein
MRRTHLIITTALLITILTVTIMTQPNQGDTTKTKNATNPTNETINLEKDTVWFSGYSWKIRNSPDTRSNPGQNYWSSSNENVWVDNAGYLHLKITNRNGKWYCPEIYIPQALGYGVYVFHTASPIDKLDKNVVLGLFTYKDDNHEIDIEYARWGQEGGLNSGFTVQPAPYTPDNAFRFATQLTGFESTHIFSWRSDKVIFETIQGNCREVDASNEKIIQLWQSRVSYDADGARTIINLWLYQGLAPSDLQEVEVVITGFEFTPLNFAGNFPVVIE